MAKQNIPGTLQHQTVIAPDRVREYGSTVAINGALEGVRNTLQSLYGSGRMPIIHVIVSTVDPLTDSGGGEISTRGAG